jgi:hypothetical protein
MDLYATVAALCTHMLHVASLPLHGYAWPEACQTHMAAPSLYSECLLWYVLVAVQQQLCEQFIGRYNKSGVYNVTLRCKAYQVCH